jgi:hypothetical protein
MQRKARLSANPFRRGAEFAVGDVGVLPVGYWQIDRTTGKTEFCTLAPTQCLEIASQ